MRQYPKYKNSNADYLGNIPSTWDLEKIKFQGKVVSGSTPETSKSEFWDGEIVWATPVDFGEDIQRYIYTSKRKITEAGLKDIGGKLVPKDSVIISSRAPIGLVAMAGVELQTNQGCKSIIPKKVIGNYLYYCLKEFSTVLENLGNETIFAELSMNTLKNFFLTVPSKEEQFQIVKYLDFKTNLIDEFISNRRKQIDLLTEQKTGIISKAVTAGIDSKVKMKFTELMWLPEIPESFEIFSLKHLVKIKITDGPHLTPKAVDDGIPFISAEAIQDYSINFESKWGYISLEDHLLFSKKCKPQNGDIFIVKSGATTGKVAYVNTNIEFNIWSPLALVRADERKVLSEYLFYSIISKKFQEQIQFSWSFGTQQNIGMGVIQNLKIFVPSPQMQKDIIEFIKAETLKIETLISKYQKQIDLMQEYRTAIISQAVTGKIDVRDWQTKTKEIIS